MTNTSLRADRMTLATKARTVPARSPQPGSRDLVDRVRLHDALGRGEVEPARGELLRCASEPLQPDRDRLVQGRRLHNRELPSKLPVGEPLIVADDGAHGVGVGAVPVVVERPRELRHHRTRRQHIEVDEVAFLGPHEVFVAGVAPTEDGQGVVGDE